MLRNGPALFGEDSLGKLLAAPVVLRSGVPSAPGPSSGAHCRLVPSGPGLLPSTSTGGAPHSGATFQPGARQPHQLQQAKPLEQPRQPKHGQSPRTTMADRRQEQQLRESLYRKGDDQFAQGTLADGDEVLNIGMQGADKRLGKGLQESLAGPASHAAVGSLDVGPTGSQWLPVNGAAYGKSGLSALRPDMGPRGGSRSVMASAASARSAAPANGVGCGLRGGRASARGRAASRRSTSSIVASPAGLAEAGEGGSAAAAWPVDSSIAGTGPKPPPSLPPNYGHSNPFQPRGYARGPAARPARGRNRGASAAKSSAVAEAAAAEIAALAFPVGGGSAGERGAGGVGRERQELERVLEAWKEELLGACGPAEGFSHVLRQLGALGQWAKALACFQWITSALARNPGKGVPLAGAGAPKGGGRLGAGELGKLVSTVVSVLGRHGRVDEAEHVFEDALSRGLGPNVYAFSAMLSAYGKGGRADAALGLFERMKAQGCAPNLITFNAAIDACAKGGAPLERAWALFQEMQQAGIAPDRITYNSLIAACSRAGAWAEALGLFQSMQDACEDGGAPEGQGRQQGAGKQRHGPGGAHRGGLPGVERDLFTFNSVIHALCKAGKMDAATRVMGEMPAAGLRPNVVTFSTMIDGFGKTDNLEAAMHMFEEMKAAGVSPDRVTYNTLVDIYGKAGLLDEALGICSCMERSGWSLDVVTFNALISAFGRGGRHVEACDLLERMKARGVQPNALTLSSLVCCLSRAGQPQHAARLCREYRAAGLKADVVMYSSLIDALGKHGLLGEALELLAEMLGEGVQPNIVTFNSLMDACTRWAGASTAPLLSHAPAPPTLPPLGLEAEAVQEIRGPGAEAGGKAGSPVAGWPAGGVRAWTLELPVGGGGAEAQSLGGEPQLHLDTAWSRVAEEGGEVVRQRGEEVEGSGEEAEDAGEEAAGAVGAIGAAAMAVIAGMQSAGVQPNVITFSAVVSACGRMIHWQQAWQLLQAMGQLQPAERGGGGNGRAGAWRTGRAGGDVGSVYAVAAALLRGGDWAISASGAVFLSSEADTSSPVASGIAPAGAPAAASGGPPSSPSSRSTVLEGTQSSSTSDVGSWEAEEVSAPVGFGRGAWTEADQEAAGQGILDADARRYTSGESDPGVTKGGESWTKALRLFHSISSLSPPTSLAFFNALLDLLWHFDQRALALHVVAAARGGGVYASATWHKTARGGRGDAAGEDAGVDVHLMSVGASLAILHYWLLGLQARALQGEPLPATLNVLTGWGRHSKVQGRSTVKAAVESQLRCLRAPFCAPPFNQGRLCCSGVAASRWLLHPSTAPLLRLSDSRPL